MSSGYDVKKEGKAQKGNNVVQDDPEIWHALSLAGAKSVLYKRTFCHGGTGLYLHCPGQYSQATCGYFNHCKFE